MAGELSKHQWKAAHDIAFELSEAETVDINEFKKIIEYWRCFWGNSTSSERFFQYLNSLVQKADSIGYSKRSGSYYQKIREACKQHLKNYDSSELLQILGWSGRLIVYYQKGVPTGELQQRKNAIDRDYGGSERQDQLAKLEQISQNESFKEEQEIEARVHSKGNQTVEYLIQGVGIKVKEPKKRINKIPDEQDAPVIVRITSLNEGGGINNVTFVRQND